MNQKSLALAVAVSLALPLTGQAMAKVKIDEDTNLEVGVRLQTQLFSTEANLDASDADYERQTSFLLRRARLRFRVNYKSWLTGYVQTDYEEQAGTSSDLRIIDAYVLLKPHALAWIYVGQNMAPASRANLTSSGGFMAIDRPSLTYRTLSWGARAKYAFTNTSYGPSSANLQRGARAPVRDLGVTLFGNQSFSDALHLKYYLGAYDGVQTSTKDDLRFTARVQLNAFDKESGYYNDATYLGEKRTVGVGATYDAQKAVAIDQASGADVDYQLYSFDAFADWRLPVGAVTAEVGYVHLDLGGGGALAPSPSGPASTLTFGIANQAQGGGFYAHAGYYVEKLQPWVEYEQWKSDAAGNVGGFKAYRAGVSYYLKGHDIKVVAGYERFEPEVPLAAGQDTVQSFLAGLYIDL